MRKKLEVLLLICLALFIFSGCSTVSVQQSSAVVNLPLSEKPIIVEPPKTADGIIFGKADFRGILKVEYVKVNIIDQSDPQKQYELLFGDTSQDNLSGWDVSPVEPHYFFLELPAGRYQISTISIPVGTTLATEEANISFEVEKGTVIYLGTLKVTGTDQKIRFGGVPLLRPGFEYRVEIINEKDEAISQFNRQYPGASRNIQIKLMKEVRFQAF